MKALPDRTMGNTSSRRNIANVEREGGGGGGGDLEEHATLTAGPGNRRRRGRDGAGALVEEKASVHLLNIAGTALQCKNDCLSAEQLLI